MTAFRERAILARWRVHAARVLFALGLLVGGLNLLGRLGALDWRFDLLVHFKPQVAVVLGVLAVALYVLARRRSALVLALLVAVELVDLVPYHLPATAALASTAPALTAVSFNVMRWNERRAQVREFIDGTAPDVIALQEIDRAWLQALAPLHAAYPYRVVPAGRIHTAVLFSRWPLSETRIVTAPGSRRAIIVATVEAPAGAFTVITTHTQAPVAPSGDNASRGQARNGQLQRIARIARASAARGAGAVLVLGDFNITPWSVHFRRFLTASGLREARRGHGLLPTWPVAWPLLRIPIDQCLYGPGIEVGEFARGPVLGSDHLPLILRFHLG